METNKVNDYLMKKMIQKEAMKRISSDYPLNDELLMKYSKDLDWEEVSGNSNIKWTAAMIDYWGDRLNWKTFSERANEEILIPELIEKFKDRWDWGRLINRGWYNNSCDLYSIEFVNRYAQYIPMEDFENSSLWDAVVEEEENAIKKEILLKDN